MVQMFYALIISFWRERDVISLRVRRAPNKSDTPLIYQKQHQIIVDVIYKIKQKDQKRIAIKRFVISSS